MRTKGAAMGTATNCKSLSASILLPRTRILTSLGIFNFLVVEITPYGIQSLGWQFYIIWTVFNAAFVPIVYFLYPETAGRSLEDIDDYFRHNPSLLVWRDKDAKRSGRPEKYIEKEQEGVRKASTADPAAARRQSRISIHSESQYGDHTEKRLNNGQEFKEHM